MIRGSFLSTGHHGRSQYVLISVQSPEGRPDWTGAAAATRKPTHVRTPLHRGTPSAAATPARATQTLMVVEDDQALRRMVVDGLRHMGYTILEAGRGEEALALAKSHAGSIDLLLTDVVMPGMNGAELARLAVGVRPALAILFMSGYAAPEEITGALRRHRLVRKPFLPSQLATQIEAALAESHAVVE